MMGLFATRNAMILILVLGIAAIVCTTIGITRLTVNRLKEADDQMIILNAQLMQSDKLAAIGKMASGVAHEINNPLAAILQRTGWMQDLLGKEEIQKSESFGEFQTSIRKIEDHVERARKVVHNMLGYARKMEPRVEDVDVNATLNQTIDILEKFARINNIDIQTDLAPGSSHHCGGSGSAPAGVSEPHLQRDRRHRQRRPDPGEEPPLRG